MSHVQALASWLAEWIGDPLNGIGVGFFVLAAAGSIYRRNRHHHFGRRLWMKAVDSKLTEPISLHPEINPALCAGCGSCTQACPEGDVLKLINHRAVLVAPSKCVGHGECFEVCPTGAITLVFGTKSRGMEIPKISKHFETNVPGLYIAGELGGMGLIRNAIKQGHLAAKHALAQLSSPGSGGSARTAEVDLLIVGAGPAGLSAALTAIAEKKSYLLIEQNSFGGTVYNFPRQKIVMSVPVELPVAGTMRFSKNRVSKEELLDYWESLRARTQLKIQEQTKFEGIKKEGEIFTVTTSGGQILAQKVILAMGVRGTPRRLGLPNEDLPKVTYHLIDPAQYQDKDIVVVGGGNAGVEAAQMLAEGKYQNRVTLLVRGLTFDRCNEKNQAKIEQMEKQGLLEIWYNSSVQAIHPSHLMIQRSGELRQLSNDYLFIFAGAEMPHNFLRGLGVQIEKKFAEPLGETRA